VTVDVNGSVEVLQCMSSVDEHQWSVTVAEYRRLIG